MNSSSILCSLCSMYKTFLILSQPLQPVTNLTLHSSLDEACNIRALVHHANNNSRSGIFGEGICHYLFSKIKVLQNYQLPNLMFNGLINKHNTVTCKTVQYYSMNKIPRK